MEIPVECFYSWFHFSLTFNSLHKCMYIVMNWKYTLIDIVNMSLSRQLENKMSWPLTSSEPYWLELSGAEFATVQLFMVAGFYITRRLNEISTLDSVRWSQKRDLWWWDIVASMHLPKMNIWRFTWLGFFCTELLVLSFTT